MWQAWHLQPFSCFDLFLFPALVWISWEWRAQKPEHPGLLLGTLQPPLAGSSTGSEELVPVEEGGACSLEEQDLG